MRRFMTGSLLLTKLMKLMKLMCLTRLINGPFHGRVLPH